MKIERINENQIRCTLSSFDLSSRDLNIRELAYGSEKARNLFREMVQKASSEVVPVLGRYGLQYFSVSYAVVWYSV